MASRKQKKVVRKARATTPRVSEKTLGESIIEQMVKHNALLEQAACTLLEMQQALVARNDMLSVVTSGDKRPILAGITVPAGTTQDEKGIHLGSGPQVPASTVAAPAGPKKRGRPSKVELAAREQAEREANAGPHAHPEEPVEQGASEPRPFPKQCPCGVREDVPKHLHAKGCPVHFPAEPVPAHRATTSESTPPPPAAPTVGEKPPAPSLDDVRATAIGFVGKHGKEKLAAMLQKYGAEKLSSVTTDKLPALLADLQAAG